MIWVDVLAARDEPGADREPHLPPPPHLSEDRQARRSFHHQGTVICHPSLTDKEAIFIGPSSGQAVLRIRDPVPFWPLDPGSRIRNRFFPDPGSQTHIFDNKRFYNSLKIDPNFFLQTSKNKIIYNFVKFVAIKKGFHPSLLLLFFDPGSEIRDPRSGIRDPGSEMGKNQDPGSEINIPDPQHCKHVCELRFSSKIALS